MIETPRYRHWPVLFKLILCAATAALALSAAPAALAASPGTLDPSFGSAGSAPLPAGTRLLASAAQSNGDVVAVGESGAGTATQLLLARFTPAGALDSSFGSGGVVSGPAVSGATGSLGRAVAIQADGKIVVVGTASDATGSARDGLLVERFNTNGTLDTSFGAGGVVNLLSGSFGDGYAVAIEPSGAILAGGAVAPAAVPYTVVARLTASGSPDATFGSAGIDVLNLGAYSIVQALAVQSNGDIVLAGSQSPGLQSVNALIARLTPAGALDPSFAGSGAIAQQYAPSGGAYSSFNGVAIESNGDIVAAGDATASNETADAVVARFTSAGAADPSFGTGGVAYAAAAARWLQQGNSFVPGAAAVTLAGNGEIIAAGQYDTSVLAYGTLWAFGSGGQLDPSFGSGGVAVFTNPSGANSEFSGVTMSPVTGNLIPVGDGFMPGGGNYAGLAASYVGYGPPPVVTPPPPPALKLTLTGVSTNYKAATVKLSAGCNEACSLAAALNAGAGTAKQLKIQTTVVRCKKVKGKTKCTPVKRCKTVKGKHTCTTVKAYRALTLATAKGSLAAAGTKTFTLHLSKAVAKALHKQKSVTLSLTVTATSTATHKTAKATKSVKFKK